VLQVVLGNSDMLLFDKTADDPEYEGLRAIRRACRHGSELVKRILAFSRNLEPNARPVNLNNEIRRVEKMLRRTIPRMIEIKLRLADDLSTVNADAGQMEQILLNLGVNAWHAMSEGGRLTVETENVTLDEEYCRADKHLTPGRHVLIKVSDTGEGMDQEVLEHIFEPFFTTKGPGEGTGLGLAMTYGIVRSHRGDVTCYSVPGAGTTFKILLPALAEEIEPDDTKTGRMPAFGNETVLIVDDERPILSMAKELLTRSGYTALTAADGREALDVYRDKRDEIALVILDMIMPKMDGRRCLEELLRIDHRVKVIVAAGRPLDGAVKVAVETGAKGVINKPYDMKELLTVVRETLDGG
ncbi:MAG: ATP-binding protein, partial [Pseudomonadota bacterium]